MKILKIDNYMIWFHFLFNYRRLMIAEKQLHDLLRIIKLILHLLNKFVMPWLKDRKEKNSFKLNNKWKYKNILRISRNKLFNLIKLIQIWNNKKNSRWKKLNKSKDHLFKKKIFNNKFMMRMMNQIIIKKKFTKR